MSIEGVFTLNMEPGIQRDGTAFRSKGWTDGQWTRFERGLPQKMLGYKQITDGGTESPNIARGMIIFPDGAGFYHVYWGDQNGLRYVIIDRNGDRIGGVFNRTPATFVPDIRYLWQFDIMYDDITDNSLLIAYAGLNLDEIDQTIRTPVYYGDLLGIGALVPLIGLQDNPFAPPPPIPKPPFPVITAGGIVVIHPHLFIYDIYGGVIWSGANDPTNFYDLGESSGKTPARIASMKVVAGKQTRGGQASPAGILWTLDSVIRVSSDPDPAIQFRFDTVTDQASILSSNGIVEVDGLFFWPAIDRFLVYNGTVQEIPNDKNRDYFFQLLNYAEREKIWATKVTEHGEIWFHFPDNRAVVPAAECNNAVIYNYREKSWYDTAINRSSGDFAQVFTNPIWSDNVPDPLTGGYPLWMHEIFVNKVFLPPPYTPRPEEPIPYSITSGSIAYCATGPSNDQWVGIDRWVLMTRFEPDFIQQIPSGYGTILLTIIGRDYAQSPDVISTPSYNIIPTTEKIDMMIQFREMRIQFSGTELDSYFEMGQPLLTLKIGDGRQ